MARKCETHTRCESDITGPDNGNAHFLSLNNTGSFPLRMSYDAVDPMKHYPLFIFGLMLCGLTLCPALFAQGDGKALVNDLVKHWQTSKELTLEVANAMPDDSYSFKATPAEMTFGGQMNHIAQANSFYCSTALGEKPPMGKASDDTKATAVKNLTSMFDYCIAGIEKLSDSDLLKEMDLRGKPNSKFELFWGGFTHTAHHRGQAEVYLRLKEITPPSYKF